MSRARAIRRHSADQRIARRSLRPVPGLPPVRPRLRALRRRNQSVQAGLAGRERGLPLRAHSDFAADSSVNVVVFSYIPSPYQVELFDAIHDLGQISLRVVYVAPGEAGRPWSTKAIRHDHRILPQSNGSDLRREIEQAD